jgi:hypothetical protein
MILVRVHGCWLSLTVHKILNVIISCLLLELDVIIIMGRLGGNLSVLLCVDSALQGSESSLLVDGVLLIVGEWVSVVLFGRLPLHIDVAFFLYVWNVEVGANMWIEVLLWVLVEVHPGVAHWVSGCLGVLRTVLHLLVAHTALHIDYAIVDIILV